MARRTNETGGVDELPDWFSLEKYHFAEGLDAAGWYEQLEIRKWLASRILAVPHQDTNNATVFGSSVLKDSGPVRHRASTPHSSNAISSGCLRVYVLAKTDLSWERTVWMEIANCWATSSRLFPALNATASRASAGVRP